MRRLSCPLLLLLAVSASAAVTGTVVTDEGAPLAGAHVRAFAREPFSATAARLLSSAPDATPIAASDSAADGRFSIDVKGNATVDLVVDADGREPAALYAADGDDAGAIALHAADKARRVKVTADGKPLPNALVYLGHSLLVRTDAQGTFVHILTGEPGFVIHPDYGVAVAAERNLEVQIRRGAAVRGRVLARDSTTPVAGATILAGGWPMARSADDGTFTIAHAPARMRGLVALSGNDAGAAAFDAAKPVQIRLGSAASLSGTVTTKTQAPVAGATVVFTHETDVYSAIADAKGHYAVAAFPAATYVAQLHHPAYADARVTEVRAVRAATRSFTMEPRARVRGTVLTDDHKPAAGAFVGQGLGSAVNNSVAITTPAGEFTLRVPGGSTLIAASKSGYATAVSPPLTLEPGATKSGVTLTLQPGFPIQIKVIDPGRQPVANAAVDVSMTGNREVFRSMPVPCSVVDRAKCRFTGADGTIETRLAVGKYDVRVSGDFVPKVLTEQALTARSSPLVVTVERGAEVSGRVLFSDGTPVADARVATTGGGMLSAATTDASGAFTLKRLQRTAESIVATTPDEPPLRSAPVKVTPPARDVRLTIPAPARVEGRVIDRATSQPVTSFTVTPAQRGGPRVYVGAGGNAGVDVTSDDGTFVLRRVQPGSFDLNVTAPGYVAGTLSDLVVEEGKALTGIEVRLDRGARVAGHVTAGGSAAAGVSVRYDSRSGRRGSSMTTTDANGDYTLDGVPPGDETFDFQKQGFVAKRKSVTLEAGKDARVDADLDRGREIRGRVVDKSGQGVPGARVVAATTSAPYAANATSEDDGQFTVSGLEDGRYTVSAQKNGWVGASVDDVDAAAGRPVTLTLDHGGTITGRVVGLLPEELPQVRVSASGHNANASQQVDAGGNFTLTGIPDGSVTLRAYKQGVPMRQSAPKVIDVVNGSAPPIEIDFAAGISVRGRVTRNAVPLAGGGVVFVPRGHGGVRSGMGMIAADGSYEVDGLDAGDYDVRVNTFGGPGGSDSVPYTVISNATFDIDLKGTTLRGVVLDADTNVPLPDVRISVTPPAGQQPQSRVWRNTVSDSDGGFALDMLPDGAYTLRADRDHYSAATQTITVSGGTAPPIELRLAHGSEAIVRIVDADTGRPLDGGVSLYDAQRKFAGSGNGRGEDGATHVWAAPGRYAASVYVNGYLPQYNIDVVVPGSEVRVALTRAATLVITSRSGGRFRVMPPARPGNATGGVVGGVVAGMMINVAIGDRIPLSTLAPGVCQVDKLTSDGKAAKTYTVTLVAGQTTTLDAD